MEYKLILSGRVSKEAIETAVKNWLRGMPTGAPSPARQVGAAARGIPLRPDLFAGHPALASRQANGSGSRQTAPVAAPAISPFSSHQMMTRGQITIAPNIHLQQLSQMGKAQIHTFVLNDREILTITQAGLQHQWGTINHGWHQPFAHQFALPSDIPSELVQQALQHAQPDVRRMSSWQKLLWAAAEGCRSQQLAGAAWETIQSMLNWESLAALVGITLVLLIPYVGEVVLIGLMGAAIYDLLVKVTHLFKQYYDTAIAATTIQDLQKAAHFFAQGIIAGLLDILAIVAGGAALTRLRMLRAQGRLTLRAWIEAISQWGRQLISRLRQGTKRVSEQLKEMAEQVATKDKKAAAQALLKQRRESFMAQVKAKALQRISESTASQRGPCFSGAMDQRTGQIFYGENFNMKNAAGRQAYKEFYQNAHPLIKSRIDAQNQAIANGTATPSMRAGTPGAHAEVVALDKALKARGGTITEADLAEIDIHNISMSNNRPGETMHRCDNCSAITRGTNTLGHN